MKYFKRKRKFKVSHNSKNYNIDCGSIKLNNNEQVTFKFNKKNYDFCQKQWGFYVSASINSRLKKEGFKIGLFKNKKNRRYIYAVDKDKKNIFQNFLKNTNHKLLKWL